MIRLAVDRMQNGITCVFRKPRNHIEHFLGRKMTHQVLKRFEGNPGGAGLLAIATQHTGIPDLISPYQMEKRIWGRHVAFGNPSVHIQGVVSSGDLNRANVNATVTFDAFLEVVLPEGFSLFFSHCQHFLKGCWGHNGRFLFNRLKSLSDNRRQCVFKGIFRHARVSAVTTLDAFRLVYLDSIGPKLAINFGGRMGFINELGCAIPTTGAFIHINVAGLFLNLNFQISLFTLNAFNGGTGMDLNIDMPADLDQFRRYNSHGTIIGWKCLIQLRHGPADGRAFFHEVNVVAGICQIQGGLHTGNASTYDHYGSPQFIRHAASPSVSKNYKFSVE